MAHYPDGAHARDRFVLDRRGHKPPNDAWRPHQVTVDRERAADGRIVHAAAVLLTGRECPWRCVMCDLWRQTTDDDTPHGAIPAQVAHARAMLAGRADIVTHVKLYNAGSFFDPRAVPEDDYEAVASALRGIAHVIVESHPALIGARTARFRDALLRNGAVEGRGPTLEVAMGLETVHPEALDRLHKRMTADTFARAAGDLQRMGVALRVFLLISPPFIPRTHQDEWLLRSVDAAAACGASMISLIPTRSGNGALDSLASDGDFHAPTFADVERSLALALARVRTRTPHVRIAADTWDLDRLATCTHCLADRRSTLERMNLEQQVLPVPACGHCRAEPAT